MQDINPIRKNLKVNESPNPDTEDIRASFGVGESESVSLQSEISELPNKREQVSFSELYTPESRRNTVDQSNWPKRSATTPKTQASQNKSRGLKKIFGILIGVILIIALFLYTFAFSSVDIKIKPVRTSIQVAQTIVVPQIDIELADSVKLETASTSMSASVPRRGTKNVESKASGVITIYNNFDSNPQKLITNTRFESQGGKIYRIAESVTVPGMKNGAPGQIDATVYADSVGADYNLSQGELTVPGFKGTSRYTKFSAKVKTALSGGSSGVQEVVADEDVNNAYNELIQKLQDKISKESDTKLTDGDFLLIKDASSVTFSDNRKELLSDKNVDFVVTAEVKNLYLKKDYLARKILENTNSNEEENLTLESLDGIVFGKDPNNTQNQLSFTINGAASFISNLDEVILKSSLTGKSKAQFADIMSQFPGIESAEPKFSPFWKTTFPKNAKDIEIQFVN